MTRGRKVPRHLISSKKFNEVRFVNDEDHILRFIVFITMGFRLSGQFVAAAAALVKPGNAIKTRIPPTSML